MPNIRPHTYLRNNYNEVSDFCYSKMEPVFITKNGHADLAVLSIEASEKFCGRNELYHLLDESLEDEKRSTYSDFDEFMTEFRNELDDLQFQNLGFR